MFGLPEITKAGRLSDGKTDGRRSNEEHVSHGLPTIGVTKAQHHAEGKTDRRGSVRGIVLLLTAPGTEQEPFQSSSEAAAYVLRKKLLDKINRRIDHPDLTRILGKAANRHYGVFGMQVRYQSDLEAHPFEDDVKVYTTGPVQSYTFGIYGEVVVFTRVQIRCRRVPR